MGAFCNMSGRAKPLYRLLDDAVYEINDGDLFTGPIKLEVANCLSMCGIGPNLMIYPEARAANGLDAEKLERVIQFLRDQPHHHDPGDSSHS
jgi:(2Fe-2S) ferredoxin